MFPAPPPDLRDLHLVGVTGTNGKTTTAALAAALLGARGSDEPARPVARVTTVGAFLDAERLDLPLDYAGMVEALRRGRAAGGRHGVLEVTSEALARGFARAWPITSAIFTNLTHDHLDAHGSPEHYFASKAQLFHFLPPDGLAILNGCDPAADLLRQVVPEGVSVITYGAPSRGAAALPLDVCAEQLDVDWAGTTAHCSVRPEARGSAFPAAFELRLRALGDIYAENALAALCCAVGLGVPLERALSTLACLEPPPGRFEVVSRDPNVVVDYAHTPDALRRTIAVARTLCRGRVHLVFGAGGQRDRDKRPLMGAVAAAADVVHLTSDNPRGEDPAHIADEISRGFPPGVAVRRELDRSEAIAGALRECASEDLVLIAGKGHETTQVLADRTLHFSDQETVRALLAR